MPMNRAFWRGRFFLLREILLTQERANFFSGENFRSLPCQQKTSPMGIKKERKKTVETALI
ncbi:hypothetical protein HQ38_08225 [Porphyromonas crevioricanis]|uniref:Uncharacterized protein n=1 Tax=Porphyromonas crevioricanis TaxID=393921 RepID=A0AB34PF15_9PORP|nr:hypothetical protein HQ38_08225 [Porphyromonas crevioricanis]